MSILHPSPAVAKPTHTADSIILGTIEAYRFQGLVATTSAWQDATKGLRSAILRRIRSVMGPDWSLATVSPASRWEAFVRACSLGTPIVSIDDEEDEEDAPTKLAINGFTYEAREIPAGECGTVAFEVLKVETNNHYHVIRDAYGLVKCDCPDYLMRHDGTAAMCKHGKALVSMGLVKTPTPIPSTVGRREFITPAVSVYRDNFPERISRPAPKARRFDPSPEEMAEATQLFGELEAERVAYRRELAAAL